MSPRASFLLFFCAALPLVGAQWTVGQAVDTTSGRLTGTHAKTNQDVSFYGAIPYAQPPVGKLRWASPVEYTSSAERNATALGPGCPANALTNEGAAEAVAKAAGNFAGSSAINNLLSIGGIGGPQDEDCLTLNVWTKPQSGDSKKAVLVWFYGGGFQFGTTNNPAYNGEYFAADQDVVLVSVNYRTNVFGFPGLPDASSASQNPGLEDQRLAIEWVRDNIAAFHGDSDRITLFGESAGGASIDMYAYAHVDDPIIAGTISESGTARSFFDPVKQNNTEAWYNMSKALGCGDTSAGAEKSLSCLREKTSAQVLNATLGTDPLTAVLGDFQPTSDNKTVFSDYKTRAAAGNFIKKPYITGNNNYEGGIFKFLASNEPVNISNNQWDVFNLLVFTCPSSDAADARAAAGVPVWRYRFFGEFPNTRLTVGPNSGAYHTGEVPVVFRTTAETSGANDTTEEVAISGYINKLWADFAKDPENALTDKYNFPHYKTGTKSLIYFGVDNETEPMVVYNNNTDASCGPVVQAIDNLGGTNALLGDPVSFSRNYGSLADSLSGFVGIGDSDHPDAPFGPPPIASQPSSSNSTTTTSTTTSSSTVKSFTTSIIYSTTTKSTITTVDRTSSASATTSSAGLPHLGNGADGLIASWLDQVTRQSIGLPKFTGLPQFDGLPKFAGF